MKDDPISHKNAIQISTNVTHDIGFIFKRCLIEWLLNENEKCFLVPLSKNLYFEKQHILDVTSRQDK